MKTSLLFLSVFLSLSLFGQSKKKQIEMLTLSKDSIQSLLSKEREAHKSSKITLTNQISELDNQINDLNNKSETQNARIANLESQQKKLETQLQVKKQELQVKEQEITRVRDELLINSDKFELEIKKLEDSLMLLSEMDSNRSYFFSNGESIDYIPFDFNSSFDFQFHYENGNGFNPLKIYPIGWSKDGKIAFKSDHCNGGCGCCSTDISVFDLRTNKYVEVLGFDLTELGYEDYVGSNETIWDLPQFKKDYVNIITKHNIIPFGFGKLVKSDVIKYPNSEKSLNVSIEKDDENYSFNLKYEDGYLTTLNSGKLEYSEICECFGDVFYVGYLISEFSNYGAFVLFSTSYGYEGEIDYHIQFIGLELKE